MFLATDKGQRVSDVPVVNLAYMSINVIWGTSKRRMLWKVSLPTRQAKG